MINTILQFKNNILIGIGVAFSAFMGFLALKERNKRVKAEDEKFEALDRVSEVEKEKDALRDKQDEAYVSENKVAVEIEDAVKEFVSNEVPNNIDKNIKVTDMKEGEERDIKI